MSYSIDMPPVLPQLKRFSLDRWEKKPGDSVAAGDSLCVLSTIAEDKANKMTWWNQRKLRRAGPTKLGAPSARVKVVALEAGILRTADAPEGAVVGVGTRLATCEGGDGGNGQFCIEAYLEPPREDEA